MEQEKRAATKRQRTLEGPGALAIVVAIALLAGLGLFAYFASVVANFPGEVSMSARVQTWQTPWLDTLMKVVSVPGLLVVALPLLVVASAALFIKGWYVESALLFTSTVVGRLVAITIKEVVGRPRPSDDLVQVLQEADGFAFPSGHVMHYTVFLGVLIMILVTRLKRGMALRLWQVVLALALIAIGLSRIYLGVHWAGDVVAGYVIGAVVVMGFVWLWRLWVDKSVT